MKLNDVFPSNYLKPDDVPGSATVTIKQVVLEPMKDKDGKEIRKAVIYFAEAEKGLICNQTNWKSIASVHGAESNDWGGKRIVLFVTPVTAFGETKPGIRIMPPAKTGLKEQAAAAEAALFPSA